jgi:16S rRNA (cytidine1402-2'-O)-methyltransferase
MASITLVPTPLGNLEDITLRALRVLREADRIAAEDTRTSSLLLRHFQIEKPLLALHMHNEHRRIPALLEEVAAAGQRLAVISDAGTPGISDPGFLMVREALRMGLSVEVLPGPTAFVPALVGSGLPCDRFVFEGFLPQKKGRLTRVKQLAEEERTLVLYESPHRLLRALEELAAHLGPERPACVCRELSKLHETYHRGSLAELSAYFAQNSPRGEIVIVVAGKE